MTHGRYGRTRGTHELERHRPRPVSESQHSQGGPTRHQRILSPITWGFFRPRILFPEAARDWSVERVGMVLTHEMAHVKRGDLFTHLVAQVCLALNWFNPFCRTIVKRLILDREHACDDYVLLRGPAAPTYAEHLMNIMKVLVTPDGVELYRNPWDQIGIAFSHP